MKSLKSFLAKNKKVVVAILCCNTLTCWLISCLNDKVEQMRGHVPVRGFNSALWKSTGGNPDVRQSMVDDLVDRRSLIGKTPGEIQQMLGPPSWLESNLYQYDLGIERAGLLAFDRALLIISFKNDKATEAHVISR